MLAESEVRALVDAASGGTGAWSSRPDVHVFGVEGGVRYVSVSDAEGSGCGEFAGSFWAMWSVTPAGKLQPIELDPYGLWTPVAVFDSDGDGKIEMVGVGSGDTRYGTYETYFTLEGDVLRPANRIVYPFSDCTC